VTALISDKADSKPKLVRRHKEGHFVVIKGTTHQEEVTNVNTDTPKVNAPNFTKQT
jgi:hypothetical protein